MLVQEEAVEVWALRKRSWSISCIARHLGRSRNTVKRYLRAEARPGRERGTKTDCRVGDWFSRSLPSRPSSNRT